MINNISHFALMIVPLLFAVTIHEFGHGYVAYKMGDDTAKAAGRLTLNPIKHLDFFGSFILPLMLKLTGAPIFGYAKPVPINPSRFYDYRKGMFLVSGAGVFANACFAVISGIIYQILLYFGYLWYKSLLKPFIMPFLGMLEYSVIINLVLMVFNLIPIPPLDGSKILAMILPLHLRAKFEQIERYGMIILIFFLMTNIPDKIISFIINPLIGLLLGV